MKTKMDIQKELINLFGNNYNSLDNLVKYLNGKYHPKYFKNFKEPGKSYAFLGAA